MDERGWTELSVGNSIGRTIHDAKSDMLPDELASDPNVKWILGFDAFLDPVGEEGRSLTVLERAFAELEQEGVSQDDIRRAILQSQISSEALQQKLGFCFASLFRIGSMLSLSQSVIKTLGDSEDPEIQMQWSSAIAEQLGDGVSDARASSILKSLANNSLRYHSAQVKLAETWWEMWKQEVMELRDVIRAVEISWSAFAHVPFRFINELFILESVAEKTSELQEQFSDRPMQVALESLEAQPEDPSVSDPMRYFADLEGLSTSLPLVSSDWELIQGREGSSAFPPQKALDPALKHAQEVASSTLSPPETLLLAMRFMNFEKQGISDSLVAKWSTQYKRRKTLPFSEIARYMGISVYAVKAYYERALKRTCKAFKDEGLM